MVHLVLEVTEVESIERKERDGRGKGNEGFPEHSTHFSLSLSLSSSSLAANDSLLIDQLEKLWEAWENGRKFTRRTEIGMDPPHVFHSER